jgi:hypothetical protein
MEPLEFRFEFSSEDFLRFQLDHEAAKKDLRASAIRFAAILTVVVLLVFGAFLSRSENPRATAGAAWPWLLGIPIYWWLVLRAPGRALRQGVERLLATEEGRSTLLGERRVRIDDAGLRWESESSTVQVAWKGVIRVVRSADHVYLYFTPIQAIVLPRRVFRSDDLFDDFVRDAEARASASRAPA